MREEWLFDGEDSLIRDDAKASSPDSSAGWERVLDGVKSIMATFGTAHESDLPINWHFLSYL